ncbi:GNAT family N-acetyltransferase [Microvirga sp. 2TAF3]|uniref:GNAT family N-acetyltransferase n=1 Tax=Microvirga sp. 2TAF3 TaxID=3233014 RepID=UPI003F9E71CB
MSAVREDAFVAVIDGGEAFFPFQRNFLGFGRPIGGPVSDYHGLIASPDYRCDAAALVRACQLRRWDFDHVPAEQAVFTPWGATEAGSPVVDISSNAPIGSSQLHSLYNRRLRQLAREVGPVEVELETKDPEILRLCLDWKSAQYRRTGSIDLFARPWAQTLAKTIAAWCETEFAGTVSVLRAGGQPVAVHFGMRSKSVWHYWFPAYDPQFNHYSPGMLLLLAMISGASKLGIKTIDFGKGDATYKLRLANRTVPLIEGSVVTHRSLLVLSQSRANLLQWVRKSPLLRLVPDRARKVIWRAQERTRFR